MVIAEFLKSAMIFAAVRVKSVRPTVL